MITLVSSSWQLICRKRGLSDEASGKVWLQVLPQSRSLRGRRFSRQPADDDSSPSRSGFILPSVLVFLKTRTSSGISSPADGFVFVSSAVATLGTEHCCGGDDRADGPRESQPHCGDGGCNGMNSCFSKFTSACMLSVVS